MGFFDDLSRWYSTGGNPGSLTNLEAGTYTRTATNPLGPGPGNPRVQDPLATPPVAPVKSKPVRATSNKPTRSNAKSTKEEPTKKSDTTDKLFETENKDRDFSSTRQNNSSFNITRFRSEVTGADSVLPTHSFLVVFAPLKGIINGSDPAYTSQQLREGAIENDLLRGALNESQKLTMRCDNIILPSLGLLQEQAIRRYGYGPTENMAYGVNTGDITMQFIVDDKSSVLQLFENWFNVIVNRDSKGGADMKTKRNGYAPYEVGYKDNYSCPEITVFAYDRSNRAVFEYNIYDAFPINLQSINLSWADENSLMKLNVTFAFTDFKINTPKILTIEENNNNIRQAGQLAFEERMERLDQEYKSSTQRSIQESVSTLPGVTIGESTLPVTVSSGTTSTPGRSISINTTTVRTPNGQDVGNA